jgi:glycolate oxidase
VRSRGHRQSTEVFFTDDPDEGESFVVARRLAIPAIERRGTLILEDVGVPLPALGALVIGTAEISGERDVEIALIAHAGDGNTHPLIVFDPTDAGRPARACIALWPGDGACDRARRHDHRGARGRAP